MPPIIDKELCISCGECVDVCPQDVFSGSEKKSIPTICYPEECWHCGACMEECPENAIRIRIPLTCMILYK